MSLPFARDAADDYPPLSALNDLLYCDRRCALHRLEQVWSDSVATLEGTGHHRRAHGELSTTCDEGWPIARGMWLRSDRLRLIGKADVVEFRSAPYPVEYKRGRRRRWDNDDVQLCAQAICLEEMLGQEVAAGAIFHVKSRRRREVRFDDSLRRLTEETARRLHQLLASGQTPLPIVKPQCRGCSLREECFPGPLSDPRQAAHYQRRLYQIDWSEVDSDLASRSARHPRRRDERKNP